MAIFFRAKRVTDPLNDRVKACLYGDDHRITGYASSGSDHDADDASSLSDLVHGFLEQESASPNPKRESENSDDGDPCDHDHPTHALRALLRPPPDDRFRAVLLSLTSEAASTFSALRTSGSPFRRAVMAALRDSGYNAGVCKTKWRSSGGLTGGNYEFIDVVGPRAAGSQRYLVDVDFAGEFEIARPTETYGRALEILPRIYVGRPEEMKQIVRVLADAAKRSLMSRELHLPPWRKNRYMQAKWLGPYRRTISQIPASAAPASSAASAFSADRDRFAAKCRCVGFDAVASAQTVVGGCCFVFSPSI